MLCRGNKSYSIAIRSRTFLTICSVLSAVCNAVTKSRQTRPPERGVPCAQVLPAGACATEFSTVSRKAKAQPIYGAVVGRGPTFLVHGKSNSSGTKVSGKVSSIVSSSNVGAVPSVGCHSARARASSSVIGAVWGWSTRRQESPVAFCGGPVSRLPFCQGASIVLRDRGCVGVVNQASGVSRGILCAGDWFSEGEHPSASGQAVEHSMGHRSCGGPSIDTCDGQA